MAIDGLIVLDSAGRPVIQTAFRAHPPAYPLLHVDAFNAAVLKAGRPADLDPVLPVPGAPGSVCCHVSHSGLHLLCPLSADGAPSPISPRRFPA